MVRKGGLEPPRLSAPPPQDGVSANSTTSARCNYRAVNILARSTRESNSRCTRFCGHLLHFTRVSDARTLRAPTRFIFACLNKVDRIAFFMPSPFAQDCLTIKNADDPHGPFPALPM